MYMQRTPDVRLRPSSPESDPTLLVPSTLAKDYTCRADTTLSGGYRFEDVCTQVCYT